MINEMKDDMKNKIKLFEEASNHDKHMLLLWQEELHMKEQEMYIKE